MSAHDERSPGDELKRRYREANAQDMARPGAHVRLRVQEHARAVLEAQKKASPATPLATREAANQPRWKISMLASIALAGLTGLLVLQFDRGTPEEKDIAFGQPGASMTAPAPAVVPAPLPSPATPPPALKAEPERPPAQARKPVPPTAAAVPAPASEQQESRKAASTDVDSAIAAAPAQGSVKRSRDASAGRESGAAAPSPTLSPTPFPASPPAAMNAAPAAPPATVPALAPPRVIVAPAPAPAAPAPAAAAAPPESLQRSESLAAPRAMAPARAFADAPSSLFQAARSGSTADITRLVQQGAPLDAADEAGRTPLMLAVINGHEAAVRQLLSLGASRTLVDRDGLSALDHSRRLALPGITALLEQGR